jgi:hypothetical protein
MTAIAARRGSDGGRLLRLALKVDAVVSGAVGVLLAAGGAALAGPLGASTAFLVTIGVLLVGYALVLYLFAARPTISRRVAWAAVVINLLWVLASIDLATTGLTRFGVGFVLAQAATALVFADLEVLGLRRAR